MRGGESSLVVRFAGFMSKTRQESFQRLCMEKHVKIVHGKICQREFDFIFQFFMAIFFILGYYKY